MIDDSLQILGMICRTAWRTPNASDAKLAATAIGVVIGAQDLAPRMPVSFFWLDSPAASFRVRERRFDFLLWVWSLHSSMRQEYRSMIGLSIDNLRVIDEWRVQAGQSDREYAGWHRSRPETRTEARKSPEGMTVGALDTAATGRLAGAGVGTYD